MADRAEDMARLLQAARSGDKEALGRLLAAHQGYLLSIARQELAPDLQAKAGASDLVQQTFLEAQRDFAHFVGESADEWKAWLKKLLRNNVANLARHYRDTGKRKAAAEVPLQGDASSAGGAAEVAADGSSPSEHLMAIEQTQAVHRALEKLPPDYRQVILLRHQEELPFEEIGRLMGRSTNAAEKLFARAIKRLQQELEPPP
jgi:RNA polymerase sigma-70 factor (ECF subfamily)